MRQKAESRKQKAEKRRSSRMLPAARCLPPSSSAGFSLVEMIVAVALFSVVMLISVGSLLALVAANRKAQALQSVMSNINIALDGMVRAIRMGSSYHCGDPPYTSAQDCIEGGTSLAFERFGGNPAQPDDQWVYRYNDVTKRIEKSENGGASWLNVTAPEVEIDEMTFYVIGTAVRVGATRDTVQPKVVVSIRGSAGSENIKTRTDFTIQATAVQRLLDI